MIDHGRAEALVDAAISLRLLYHSLGNEVVADPRGWFVRNLTRPSVYMANHLRAPRAAGTHDIDGLLARADEHFAACDHRLVACDPHTPPEVEARLLADGYEADAEIELVLIGPATATRPGPAGLAIRPAEGDDDWAVLARMMRADDLEQCARRRDPPYPQEVSDGLVADHRGKGPRLQYWLASLDGVDVAHAASMVGEHGVGLVEDVYTAPDVRRRGIAAELISHAVERLRADTDAVLIGARPGDDPVRLYRALGFAPLYLERSYLRRPVGPGG